MSLDVRFRCKLTPSLPLNKRGWQCGGGLWRLTLLGCWHSWALASGVHAVVGRVETAPPPALLHPSLTPSKHTLPSPSSQDPNNAKNGSDFLFERSLTWKVGDVIKKYHSGRPVLVFCASRTGASSLATHLAKTKYERSSSVRGRVEYTFTYTQYRARPAPGFIFSLSPPSHHAAPPPLRSFQVRARSLGQRHRPGDAAETGKHCRRDGHREPRAPPPARHWIPPRRPSLVRSSGRGGCVRDRGGAGPLLDLDLSTRSEPARAARRDQKHAVLGWCTGVPGVRAARDHPNDRARGAPWI